jgi:hypothetical protein
MGVVLPKMLISCRSSLSIPFRLFEVCQGAERGNRQSLIALITQTSVLEQELHLVHIGLF